MHMDLEYWNLLASACKKAVEKVRYYYPQLSRCNKLIFMVSTFLTEMSTVNSHYSLIRFLNSLMVSCSTGSLARSATILSQACRTVV